MLRFFPPSVFQRRVCVGGKFYLKLCNNQRGVLLREEKYNTREQRGVGGSGGSGREREILFRGHDVQQICAAIAGLGWNMYCDFLVACSVFECARGCVRASVQCVCETRLGRAHISSRTTAFLSSQYILYLQQVDGTALKRSRFE